MKILLNALIAFVFLLFSCEAEQSATISLKEKEEINWDEKTISEAKQLMENKCYVCHSPKVKEELLIAPPMIAIKEVYIKGSDENDFINNMRNWLLHPSEEISKMPEAIEKYGMMPKQQYSERTILLISKYLFREDIAEPDWWVEHPNNSNEALRDSVDLSALTPLERGAYFAGQTKQLLGQNLMGKIQQEGVEEALIFCNEHAIPLTTEMERKFGVKIRRVSDKPRNPENTANNDEVELIAFYQSEINTGKEPNGRIVKSKDGTNVFHAPIVTNDMCLKCHGEKKDIEKNVFNKINELYPNDKAKGYNENEVRGIWRILLDN